MRKKGGVNPWVVAGVLGAVGYFAWRATKEKKKNREQDSRRNFQNHENQPVPETSFVDEREITKLYHELVVRYHPDKASGENDKLFRTELFKKIKKAYDARDVETLKLFKLE